MPWKPPNPFVELRPGEVPTPERLQELFRFIQENFDAIPHLPSGTPWAPVPVAVGWENYEASTGLFQNVQYRKGADGRVYLRGLVKHTGSIEAGHQSLIATLPAGFRPSKQLGFPGQGLDATGPRCLRVDMRANGELVYEPFVSGAVAFLFLDAISFYPN